MIKSIDHGNVIHYGTDSIILKVPSNEFNKPYCLKILVEEFPAPSVLKQLDNEYQICSGIPCSGIRKALERKTVENHEAILFEFIEGKDLGSIIQSGQKSMVEKLQLAFDISSALTDLQKENIFHGRLSASNILVEKSTDKIYLIDFSFAVQSKQADGVYPVSQVTRPDELRYISPEQTGRINRSVDSRADLYALGVIFYQLFTGVVPFESNDSLELTFAHIAKKPADPNSLARDIPPMVSAIIGKLLEKNAEDRYQSAFGVRHDLETCLHQYQQKGTIENFILAKTDFSGKFSLPQKLYGRERETEVMIRTFDAVVNGEKRILFVSGSAGSGKSALIAEIQKPLVLRKGLFIKGKFDQVKTEIPYAAFVQAFSELVAFLMSQSREVQADWKRKITAAMGNTGAVLTTFIPGIESFIGKKPEIPELRGVEAQNRFHFELINFIRAIAARDHPLVLVIDDLQWADASSLNLFQVIAENRDIRHFALIGAFRDHELPDGNLMEKKLEELRLESLVLDLIELHNLEINDVEALVEDVLRTSQVNAASLAGIVYDKTKGNAFYVRQFLQSVFNEGLLRFDFENQQWLWNADLIRQMNVSGNVVDLMTSLIQKLPLATVDLLKTASCIGNRFDKRSLSVVKKLNEKNIENLLNQPITAGLVIPAGSQYKFAHDRIQQSVYSLISNEEKKEIHLNIGRRLTADCNEIELNDRIFDLVNQWNLGSSLIEDSKTKKYLASLNLSAGRKAISSAAYPQALQFFEKAIQLMGRSSWDGQYDYMLELTNEAAESSYLSGAYDKVDLYTSDLLGQSKTLIDSIKAHELIIKKLIAQNKPLDAVKKGLEVLEKLGISLPLKPGKIQVAALLMRTRWMLRNKKMDYFLNQPPMNDHRMNAAMRILSDITSASFFAVPDLVPVLILKMVTLTVKFGLSRKSPFSFAAFGYILSVYLNEIDKGVEYGEIARNLAEKLRTDEQLPPIMVTYNIFLSHWRKPFADTIPDMENAFRSSLESGDHEYGAYAAHNLVYQLFIMGSTLPGLSQKSERLDQQIEKFRQDLTHRRLRIFRQSVLNLLESRDVPDLISGSVFDEGEMTLENVTKNNEIYFHNLYLQKLFLALVFNQLERAEKYVPVVERFQESVKGTALYPLFYYYRSLLICWKFSGQPGSINKTDLAILKKDIRLFRKYEQRSEQKFSHKRMLLEAVLKEIEGDPVQAKILFDQSLKSATESGITHELALSWERAAAFFVHSHQDLLAGFYLRNAYREYHRWGATAKLEQMKQHYGRLLKSAELDAQEDLPGESIKAGTSSLDLDSVLKASAAISGEIILPKLLSRLMQLLLENAGAQRGFFIMEEDGEKLIRAEVSVELMEVKTMQDLPVKNCGLLSEAVVNYVFQKREPVILDQALTSPLFANDDFIRRHESKSVLCFPLTNMGKIQGVVYLSNDLMSGAFTENRLALLKLLSGQMAISIENALFYGELESKVEERTRELNEEKRKSEDLLLNILPEEVANELKQTGRTTPRNYPDVTVMFTDFIDFTSRSEQLSPTALVQVVDTCFRKFDEIMDKYNLEKIKTIGDAYLCVSGLPDIRSHSPLNVVKAALEIVEFMKQYRYSDSENEKDLFDIRIGIHTGPVVAGVVGNRKFAFDIWGDTVNTAARMEQNCEPNHINISQNTFERVKDRISCQSRGKIAAKNKGMIEMYYVEKIM